jgi:hypothetical protein
MSSQVIARHAVRAKQRGRAPRSVFAVFFAGLVLVFLLTLAVLVFWGGSYYATPLDGRATHPLYALLKPSGLVGRSLGIAGTVMMLLIFLYSVRKKSTTLQRFGTQAQWLKVHIFLGIAGPVLVTFHTSGKLNGVVAIAFYSMWAMVLSGVVGRYLYAKIPRTISGNQMTLNEIEGELAEMVNLLRESERREEVLSGITSFLGATRKGSGGLVRTLGRVLRDDAGLPFAFLRVFAIVSRDRSLHFGERLRVSRLVLRQKRLLNKLAVLDAMKRLFSYWHIFHKPFTVITFVIVFLHVGIAVYLGYGLRW